MTHTFFVQRKCMTQESLIPCQIHRTSSCLLKSMVHFFYVGYSESKYRLCISLAHPRNCHFAHVHVISSINWEATDAISWNSCYVYICSCALNMFKTIEGASDCVTRSVIRFLNARNVLPSGIYHHICQVYGDNAMIDGMVRKWVRMFNEGRENVH